MIALPALGLRQYLMIGGGIALLVALVGAYFYGHARGVHAERNRWQIVQAKETVDRAAQEAKNRTEEQRRFTAQQEIANNAIQERDKARADADAASAAGARLRTKIRDLTMSIALRDPTSVAGGETAAETVNLLGGVLERADTATDAIARYADEAAAAGKACELSYDALKVGK